MRTRSLGQAVWCRRSCSGGWPASRALHITLRLTALVPFGSPGEQNVLYSRYGNSAGNQHPCIPAGPQRSEGLGGARLHFWSAATLTSSVWLSPREELAPVQMHKECSSQCSALGLIAFYKDLPAPRSPRVWFIEATGEQVQDCCWSGHWLPSVDVCSEGKHRKIMPASSIYRR